MINNQHQKKLADKKDAPGNNEYNSLYSTRQSIQICSHFSNQSDKYLVVPEWKNNISTAFNVLIKMEFKV